MTSPAAAAPNAAPSTSAPSVSSSSPAPKTSSAPGTSAPSGVSANSAPSSAGSANAPAGNSAAALADQVAGQVSGQSPDSPTDKTNAAAAKQAAEEIRKFKLKINGREEEVDEQTLVRKAQLASAADEKFREAAEMRKSAEQFFETLKTNPKAILMNPEFQQMIGFREIAEEYLGGELKRELMDPVQRELEDLRDFKRKQEEALKSQEQERLTKAQQQELQQLQQRAMQEYDTKITEALQTSSIAKTPEAVSRVVGLMEKALTNGYDLDPATAVAMVQDQYRTDLQAMAGTLDGEQLVKFFGDDIIKKLRKYDLTRIKQQLEPAPVAAPAPAPAAREPKQPSQNPGLRPNEWLDRIAQKAGV